MSGTAMQPGRTIRARGLAAAALVGVLTAGIAVGGPGCAMYATASKSAPGEAAYDADESRNARLLSMFKTDSKGEAPRRDGTAGGVLASDAGNGAATRPAPPELSKIDVTRRVIYTAGLTLVVTETEPTLVKIRTLAESVGGWMSDQTKTRITVRVPAAKFRESLEAVEALGTVTSRSINARDVTDEYVDLEARLRAARNVRGRLQELLAKAKSVEEALAVEKELRRLDEEIERLEGKLAVLSKQVAYSTITVELVAQRAAEPTRVPEPRIPAGWIRELDVRRLLE